MILSILDVEKLTMEPRPPVLHIKGWCPDPTGVYKELLEYPWRQEKLTMFGKTIEEPRKVMWFGPKSYTYAGRKNKPLKWTQLLIDLGELASDTVNKILGEEIGFNSVFCNLYKDGDNYIGWHADDEPGLASPIIASISFGASRDFKLQHNKSKEIWTFVLSTGDLVLMHADCQKNYKHSLPKRKRVKESRINLTYRFYEEN